MFYCLVMGHSVHHSKLSSDYKLVLVNGTQWQYYGTPGVSGVLLMVWNSSLINAERVNIELWGYEEFGEWNKNMLGMQIPLKSNNLREKVG